MRKRRSLRRYRAAGIHFSAIMLLTLTLLSVWFRFGFGAQQATAPPHARRQYVQLTMSGTRLVFMLGDQPNADPPSRSSDFFWNRRPAHHGIAVLWSGGWSTPKLVQHAQQRSFVFREFDVPMLYACAAMSALSGAVFVRHRRRR